MRYGTEDISKIVNYVKDDVHYERNSTLHELQKMEGKVGGRLCNYLGQCLPSIIAKEVGMHQYMYN